MKARTLGSVARKIVAVSSFAMTLGSAMAWPVLPAAPCTGNNCLQYTDFSVYSLALINLQGGGSGSPSSGQAGYVDASDGQIANYVVIGTGSGGATLTNTSGVDDGYVTGQGAVTVNTMATDTAGGPATGDGNSWQASISALYTQFLNSNFVAFFGFTEPGTSDPPTPLNGADLLIWAKVSVIDLQGLSVTKSFYLQPNGSTLSNDPLGSPLPPDTTLGDSGPWVYVHSKMCVGPGNTFAGFPDATGNCPTGTSIKDTNTGNNAASFAVYNSELDAIIHDQTTQFDILQIDWQMAYLDGAGESAWIQPWLVAQPNKTPEPGTVMLLALALLGLWGSQRTRKSF